MGSSNKSRRHYKKDSRFVADLYTFTYDDFDLEDDNDTTRAPVPVPEVTVLEKPKEEKDPEREDLIARFDRLIRGDPDDTLERICSNVKVREWSCKGKKKKLERARKPRSFISCTSIRIRSRNERRAYGDQRVEDLFTREEIREVDCTYIQGNTLFANSDGTTVRRLEGDSQWVRTPKTCALNAEESQAFSLAYKVVRIGSIPLCEHPLKLEPF
uniref:Uncharacterized protein n=1 Tax=Vespula pensylvanica TaxID=30213 RepID=A0A834K9J1_VESPE|nr:hypothetical protein H0235_015213 [Vespula pensylvanica]